MQKEAEMDSNGNYKRDTEKIMRHYNINLYKKSTKLEEVREITCVSKTWRNRSSEDDLSQNHTNTHYVFARTSRILLPKAYICFGYHAKPVSE